jgi:hypothetical protein
MTTKARSRKHSNRKLSATLEQRYLSLYGTDQFADLRGIARDLNPSPDKLGSNNPADDLPSSKSR